MKIAIANLGTIKQAEFTLGDLTILCGGNNTGKTYATYALYGFLTYWRDYATSLSEVQTQQLLNEGSLEIDLNEYVPIGTRILQSCCSDFTKVLPIIFAAPAKRFADSDFNISLSPEEIHPSRAFNRNFGNSRAQLLSISKTADSPKVSISLLFDQDKVRIQPKTISAIIGSGLKTILFGDSLPTPFIASAERTGAAIFRKELNFARNRLLEKLGSMERDLNPFELISQAYSDYALPVKSNVDFTRQLESLAKNESFIAKEHRQVLDDFAGIIGGDYHVTRNDELYYLPKGKRVKLTMDESSSAVRSLLDIGFYLRHAAKPGDLLMVDEPELNLHPENQRKVARLFARLINLGIKVFITTHSDYIIKELNTLIMLNQDDDRLREIALREGYRSEELLGAERVRVYIAEEKLLKAQNGARKSRGMTLVPASIDPKYGIEAKSFDTTIDVMNRIQEDIVWGGAS